MALGSSEICEGCGACCVGQLVVVRPDDRVPTPMVEDHLMRWQCGRCIALNGRIGRDAVCTIYERRPEICRALAQGSWACIEMRRACGLFGPVENPLDPARGSWHD